VIIGRPGDGKYGFFVLKPGRAINKREIRISVCRRAVA
jgi:hypothetical protein